MSKEGMLGRLPLALYGLPNDRLNLSLELMNLLGGENGPAWTAHLRRTVNAGLPEKPKLSVLKLVNPSVQLDAIASHDPSGFKTRPGLWVSYEFHSRVGSKAKPVTNLSAITLTSADLTKNAYDMDIKSDSVMPANHVFESESEFVACLDQMIQKQPEGKEGDLLTNGYWNIFYVAGCFVRVGWSSDRREWHVYAGELGGDRWSAGLCVFSRN